MTDAHFKRIVLQALAGIRQDVRELEYRQSIILQQSTARCNAMTKLLQAVDQRNRKLDELTASLNRAIDDQDDSWWRGEN